ncbi:radical SAM domain-containing protein [Candidatus Magnetobacterium bavaricum]|uniref:Radical SAM domain-containing protein n=1 Tax=Candidatus Magnetobacterium bavaricum TaxID=29290 RepID=A0A0F3GXR7_9BACT|nr:radical SAM domain-containing protein [Candidatus Magnetobacterium bavaricum]
MKIVYINPPYGKDFVRSARWSARSRGRVQRHPEQALTQIAVLEMAGHQCKFIEGAAKNMSEELVLDEIRRFGPEMAIIHTTTPSIYGDISYAQKTKELIAGELKSKERIGCMTVLVGAHASASPDECLLHGGVDAVARGECDYTLRELAAGKPLTEIDSISYIDNGKVVHNKNRPLLDVNELPFPSWSHVDPGWYRDGGKLYPFLTLYTGRGCFGRCTFCRETQLINGRMLRMRRAELIADEIEHDLRLFPFIREIMFETDTFTAAPYHVSEVCHEILRRGINKRVQWSCNVRVDVKPELLPLMKKAGCRMLMVGFEFGSDEQLDAVKKGTTVEMARRFAETARRLGFTIHGCFMIGAPGETRQSAQKTIDFAKSLPLDTAQISGIAVYPGTEMYAWAKENNYIRAKDWPDWVDEDCEQKTILSYPQMSKEEIDYYIDKGLREFYLRPKQVLKMLATVRSLDDVVRKLYGLRGFVDYFTRKKP